MEDDADLELLTSLLEESEATERHGVGADDSSEVDEYDELFDADENGSFHESDNVSDDQAVGVQEDVTTLFGDIDDLDEETPEPVPLKKVQTSTFREEKSKHELEDELRKMQEQMRKLQEQLKQTALAQTTRPSQPRKSPANKLKAPATKLHCSPLKERNVRSLKESTAFSAQLSSQAVPLAKTQETTKRKLNMPENKSPPQKQKPSFSSPPEMSLARPGPSPGTSQAATSARPPFTHHITVERFSGLRLRNPKVSSTEMERKMNGRKLIKLSMLQSKLATEKLEDDDWVTFGVVVKKMTPQSSNNGKTFSIWRLNDLKNLDRYVLLFLFGDVHKEHWKTEQGTAVGILNANPMKPKEGSDEVCLSVDNPQKILLIGESMDLGTCKARKKNGDPCTQMVNLNDCEFCQFHVQSQYKKVSAKRADLQSSYSGHIPKKSKGRNGLKERLCQNGFHYGGMSSMAYAATLAAAVPKKAVQTTLSNMVVRGADAIALQERQKIAAMKKSSVPCSEEFKELMSVPTPGALNLKKISAAVQVPMKQDAPFQSISASALLKQQKQQLLEARKKRSEDIQRKFLESTDKSERSSTVASTSQITFQSPKPGAEFPRAPKMETPKLGRGFAEGEDVLFFDTSPPVAPKLSASAEAKKMAAIQRLQVKGQMLTKQDPNGIKRKRSSTSDVEQVIRRVVNNESSPEGEDEPAVKKHREQLAYLESEEFKRILNAKSKHTGVLKEAEAEIQEQYFDPLVKKEQLEEKMRSIKEQKCRVVTCTTCKYTYYKPLETCVQENHDFHWHDSLKRFFKCTCGNRTVSLDRLPKKHCSNCGLFKWERDGMLKEKRGPKIGAETLLPRGEEHARFLNSLQ